MGSRHTAVVACGLAVLLAACSAPPPPRASDAPSSVTRPQAEGTADPILAALDRAAERAALGDRDTAERSVREALQRLEGLVGADHPALLGPLLQLALLVSDQRRTGEAELLFERATRLAEGGDGLDRARLQTYRAIHLAGAGRLETAVAEARAATLARRDALARLTGQPERLAVGLAELAHGLAAEATINLRLGRLDPAEFAANLARRVLVDLADVPEWWIAEVDEIVGLIEAERSRFDPARDRVGTAVATRLQVFGERRPVGLGFLALGRINDRAGAAAQAQEDMRRGMDVLSQPDGGGIGFARLNDYLTTMAPAAGDRTIQQEMVAATQLAWRGTASRAVSLTVARLAAESQSGGADIQALQQAVVARDTARLTLGRESARPSEARDEALIERLRRELEAASQAVEAANQRLSANHPRLAALIETSPVAVADVAGALRADEALLAFSIGPEAAWVVAIDRTTVLIRPLPITGAEIERRVTALRRSLDTGGGAPQPFDLGLSHQLYQDLFGPVAAVVSPARRLTLVLDGALQSLPPALLVQAPAAPGDYRSARWLGQDKALTLAPSIRSFYDLRQGARGSTAPRPLFAVGNPALTGRAAGLATLGRYCQSTAPIPADLVRALAPLPDTAAEVRQVALALGAGRQDVLLGTAATEGAVRAAALDQYRVLYFATHGLLPGELRCETEPALVLTPPGTATSRDSDGLLTASEVAKLTLDADLVVLSACNTAAAGDLGGESLSGLARAFFHAGARSLLVSHWPVDSRATATLMTNAFSATQRGSTDERLRAAQAALIADSSTAHPFYWAAFTLVGDGRVTLGGS
ncbi:MAG: CHAT domain-containing protein [Alphaproteobacteria bacterium]|nr:MAG: CHAT domain-containing protein [Alphaproteobacteria bacterium]